MSLELNYQVLLHRAILAPSPEWSSANALLAIALMLQEKFFGGDDVDG